MVKRSNNKHQFDANDNTKTKMVPKNELMPLYKATLQHIRFEATTSKLQTWIFI
jgi:hypothetical protein